MKSLIDQIIELDAITTELQQAAADGNWMLAELLQGKRATIIAQIIACAKTCQLSEEEYQLLEGIRRQEADIIAQASDRRNSLGQALSQLRARPADTTGKKKLLDKTYGAPTHRR